MRIYKFKFQDRSSLRGIVFVVDSATFGKRSRDVAEFLYDVIAESGKKVRKLGFYIWFGLNQDVNREPAYPRDLCGTRMLKLMKYRVSVSTVLVAEIFKRML